MAGVLPPCGNSGALAVAQNLDRKVEGLLLEAAALRGSVSCWYPATAPTPTDPSCGNCPNALLSLDGFAKMPNSFCLCSPPPSPAPADGPAAMARRLLRPSKSYMMTLCRCSRSALSPPAQYAKSR